MRIACMADAPPGGLCLCAMLPRMPQLRHPVGNLHVTTGVERIASRICTTIDTADAKRLGDVLPAAQSRRSQHVEANLGCCSVAAAAWLEQTGRVIAAVGVELHR